MIRSNWLIKYCKWHKSMNVITKQNIFFSSFYLSAKIYWKSIELSPIIMRANKRQNHRVFLIIEIGLISRIDIAFFRFKMIDEFSSGNQTSDTSIFSEFHLISYTLLLLFWITYYFTLLKANHRINQSLSWLFPITYAV